MSTLCPCASGKPFAECCEPYHKGAPAPTAEALMRARYSAYATQNIDFLRESSTEKVRKEFDAEASREWSQSAEWTGMEVLATAQGGEDDELGLVEFVANYSIDGTPYQHHERSIFVRVDGQWRFDDGALVSPDPIRRETPKIGRNDPCPCGSGKKYKKCCGK